MVKFDFQTFIPHAIAISDLSEFLEQSVASSFL